MNSKEEAKDIQLSINASSSSLLYAPTPKTTEKMHGSAPFVPTSAEMGSSIFYSFEICPQKPKATTTGAANIVCPLAKAH